MDGAILLIHCLFVMGGVPGSCFIAVSGKMAVARKHNLPVTAKRNQCGRESLHEGK